MGVFAERHAFQSAAVANGNGTAMTVEGYAGVGVQVEGITTATVTFYLSIDGSTYYAVQAVNLNDGSVATSTAADGLFLVPCAGALSMRCVISGYSAGTITVSGVGVVNAAAVNLSDVAGAVTVASEGITIAQTPTVTAGAYTAGDAVGGLLTFANAARASGGGGVIKGVVIVDDAGQDVELELWLFDRTFTAMVDNAAWAPSEADLENLIAVISTEDSAQGWLAAGTPSAIDIEVARRYDLSGTSLFGQLVTRGTPAFAATDDVTVKVALLQD
jgi:hypothetical protein